jgi:hypothetical protein
MPPTKPKVVIPSFDDPSIETVPFSPSDEVLPPNPFPMPAESDQPITLEELHRLDPSVRDIQIISIEDAAAGTTLY